MEPSTKLEELYSYHQKGMEEILSRQQLEELFRHPEQKTGEFEHWLNTQCQTGQLKKLVPVRGTYKIWKSDCRKTQRDWNVRGAVVKALSDFAGAAKVD